MRELPEAINGIVARYEKTHNPEPKKPHKHQTISDDDGTLWVQDGTRHSLFLPYARAIINAIKNPDENSYKAVASSAREKLIRRLAKIIAVQESPAVLPRHENNLSIEHVDFSEEEPSEDTLRAVEAMEIIEEDGTTERKAKKIPTSEQVNQATAIAEGFADTVSDADLSTPRRIKKTRSHRRH